MMRIKPFLPKIVAVGVLLLGAACAGLQPPVEAPPGTGAAQVVSMTASSFEFRPNNIVATAGNTLTLTVENTSRMTHNLTVTAPDGTVLVGTDLPGEDTISLQVPLRDPGVYEFYCDKPMHPTLGMEGRIEAR